MGTPQIPSVDSDTKLFPSAVMGALYGKYTSTPDYTRTSGYLPSGLFDARRHVYNVKRNLRRVQSKLGLAAAGVGHCHIVLAGDSTTAGLGANRATTSYPAAFKKLMAVNGFPVAGSGWVITGANALDPRVVLTGAWQSPSNLLHSYSTTIGDKVTWNHTDQGTVVRIYYTRNSNAFTYQIDGGAAVTVTPDLANGDIVYVEVTGLALSAHTVVVTNTGGTIQPIASECRTVTGVSVSNLGSNGTTTAAWATTTPGSFGFGLAQTSADLIVIGLGINDSIQGFTPDQTYGYMTSIINYLRASGGTPDIVINAPNPIGATQTLPVTIQALYKVADAAGIPLVDLTDLMGTSDLQTSYGTMFDMTHPNPAGYAAIARTVAGLLM